MRGEKARALILFFLSLLLSGVILLGRLNSQTPVLDTDIQSILPQENGRKTAHSAIDALSAAFTDRVTFLIEADTPELTKSARASLDEALTASGIFVNDLADANTTGRWIFENRNELLCEASPEEFTAKKAKTVWQSALGQVFGVGIPLSGDLLQADPFLLTYRLSDCLPGKMGSDSFRDGVLTGQLTSSAGSLSTQKQITSIVDDWNANWQVKGASLSRMGSVFHAAHGAASAKGEISTIGGISLIGVILTFLYAFRRARALLLVSLLIGSSILTGLSTTLLVFPKIHILVLVFAAMLIGVVADYAVHAMAARCSENWPDEKQSRSLIRKPLTISMMTTVAGFAGLFFLHVGMLAQLAVFAVSGVLSAWLIVQFCLIPFDQPPRHRDAARKGWDKRVRLAETTICKRPVLLATSLILIALTILGGLNYSTQDDVRAFQALDSDLSAEENRVKSVLNVQGASQYLVSEGSTLDAAKRAEEQAVLHLGEDQISGVRFTRFDPSEQRRAETRKAIEENLISPYEATARQTFGLKDFTPTETASPSRPAWLEQLHFENADGTHFLVAQLAPGAHGLPTSGTNVHIVDIAGTYSKAFAHYRTLMTYSLGIASCIALIAVFLIYRRTGSLLIVLCPFVAMVSGILIPCVFGVPVSFFSLAGGMVLFGIGVDYAVFFWEAREKRESWTLASVLIGAITTELSMGLLGFSKTFPVQSFGITVAIGVICALSYTILLLGQFNTGKIVHEYSEL